MSTQTQYGRPFVTQWHEHGTGGTCRALQAVGRFYEYLITDGEGNLPTESDITLSIMVRDTCEPVAEARHLTLIDAMAAAFRHANTDAQRGSE